MPRKSEPSEAEQSREALAVAKQRYAEALDLLENKQAELAVGEAQLDAGELNALDVIADLRHAVDDLQRVANARAEALKLAKRNLVADDLALGEKVASVVQAALNVPAEVSNVKPASAPEAVPSIVVTQRRPFGYNLDSGQITGRVVVRYFRSDQHVPLNERDLDRILDDAGVNANGRIALRREVLDGVIVDVAVLDRASAFPLSLPIITTAGASSYDIKWAAERLAVRAARAAGYDYALRAGRGIPRNASGRPVTGMAVAVESGTPVAAGTAGAVSIVSDVTEDGVRELVAEFAVVTHDRDGHRRKPADHVAATQRSLDEQIGEDFPGVGRIAAVEIIKTSPAGVKYGNSAGARVDVRVTFQSSTVLP